MRLNLRFRTLNEDKKIDLRISFVAVRLKFGTLNEKGEEGEEEAVVTKVVEFTVDDEALEEF